VRLQGVPGIRKVFLREAKRTRLDPGRGFVTDNEWVLDTEGETLLGMRLQGQGVRVPA
jgi:hypothetical protein